MRPPVAVALGDPRGVGPELVARALPRLKGRWILFGDTRTLSRMPKGPGIEKRRVPADAGMNSLLAGIDLCLSGEACALFTAPVSKAALGVKGQTEVLSERTGRPTTMMLAGKGLRVSLVTVHEPLAKVPRLVTRRRVRETALRTAEGLKRWFSIRRPRIAVLGLNPHAGEGGMLGREEIREIAPAVRDLRRAGIRAEGPLPADGAFGRWRQDAFDAYVAMYHDQGLSALKAVAFSQGVTLTLGLPFLRTSPDHGTAYGLAGTGKADPGPTLAALRMAQRVAESEKS